MKLNYRTRLFIYFAAAFAIFTIGIVAFEQSREKYFKRLALEEKLDAYAEITNSVLTDNYVTGGYHVALDSLINILPQNIRLTVVDSNGLVGYDNTINVFEDLENHSARPEIELASKKNIGTAIRTSESTNQDYLYYAKKYNSYFIRVALPYDVQTKKLLKEDNLFIYFVLIFFVVMLVLINAITGRFSKSISQLRDFVMSSDTDGNIKYSFPKDELGEIGTKITESFTQLKENKKTIDLEREKLLQHVHSSEEGICFFSEDRKVQFYNGLFIRYLNVISDEPNSEPKSIFSDTVFNDINEFLSSMNGIFYDTQISKHGKVFSVRVNIFEDKGFEVILNDITKQEKTRKLKQEMTGNISHELRTPVTSIRGYLETVLEHNLDDNQKQHFINQAYNQTIVLSELMQDMSLITKIEEVPQSFRLENIIVCKLLDAIKADYADIFKEKAIDMTWDVPHDAGIRGNKNLVFSIFRNLVDNSVRYAGSDINIKVSLIKTDDRFYYFSFYDTGIGIEDEKHLTRLFERFYRINEGRSRDTGGSGLGLSIVKNAIAFHGGSIIARNRVGGGLEFLFQLGLSAI